MEGGSSNKRRRSRKGKGAGKESKQPSTVSAATQSAVQKLAHYSYATNAVLVQKPGFARLLYTNPVCLLTSVSRATSSDQKQQMRRNVMTISWLTATDNHGNFVCSMNAGRFSAKLAVPSGRFVLSVPVAGMEELVRAIGGCSGADVDKFDALNLPICRPGWRKFEDADKDIAAPADVETKMTTAADSSKGDSKVGEKRKREDSEAGGGAGAAAAAAAELDRLLEQSDKHGDIAIAPCCAHLVCSIVEVQDNKVPGHLILFARVVLAWVMKSHWDGSRFCPQNPSVRPYLTFFGGGSFGHLVPAAAGFAEPAASAAGSAGAAAAGTTAADEKSGSDKPKQESEKS